MKNKSLFILIVFFIISRVIFINPDPVFFDSQEYMNRMSDPNFFRALYSGHLPLHSGYIIFLWPFFQLAKILNFNQVAFVILIQIILSLLSIISFYKLTKILISKDMSIHASILISVIPILWITNVSVMMESVYVPIFLLSIYFLVKFLKYCGYINLITSLILLSLSFLTHLVIILWLPFIFYLVFYVNKHLLIKVSSFILLIILLSSFLNGYFISIQLNTDIFEGVKQLYTSKMGERSQIDVSINGISVFIRNFIIPLLRNNTNLLIILSFMGIIKSFINNKKLFILLALWILPSVVTNQWWDSLFFGRHAILASFGIALSAIFFVNKNKFLYYSLIIFVLITSLPAIMLLKGEIPYIKESEASKYLPREGILIESHFARPQIDKQYKGKTIFVDEPGWNKDGLESEINNSLKKNKPVFITAQALSEPYGLYSGPYLHSLSLSYYKNYLLKNIIQKYTLKEYKIINKEDNIIVYQIISSAPSAYPQIKNMKYSRRRLDFFDPISQIWFVISKKLNLDV